MKDCCCYFPATRQSYRGNWGAHVGSKTPAVSLLNPLPTQCSLSRPQEQWQEIALRFVS